MAVHKVIFVIRKTTVNLAIEAFEETSIYLLSAIDHISSDRDILKIIAADTY